MFYEPQTDDPSRTADYGYFPSERIRWPRITTEVLVNAIETGVEPEGAPFIDWVPLLFKGSDHEPITINDALHDFRIWLQGSEVRTVGDAMDILSDIAHELYGENNE